MARSQPRPQRCQAHAEAGGRGGSAERSSPRHRAVERRAIIAVVANNPLRRRRRNAVAGRLLSRLSHKPGDRYPHLGPPPARFGRQPCARLAVLLVSSQRANAGITVLHAVPPAARWSKSMPMEFLHGRPLSPEDLERIRVEIESFDNIDVIDDEIRGIVARNWPYLLEKLPPDED